MGSKRRVWVMGCWGVAGVVLVATTMGVDSSGNFAYAGLSLDGLIIPAVLFVAGLAGFVRKLA